MLLRNSQKKKKKLYLVRIIWNYYPCIKIITSFPFHSLALCLWWKRGKITKWRVITYKLKAVTRPKWHWWGKNCHKSTELRMNKCSSMITGIQPNCNITVYSAKCNLSIHLLLIFINTQDFWGHVVHLLGSWSNLRAVAVKRTLLFLWCHG